MSRSPLRRVAGPALAVTASLIASALPVLASPASAAPSTTVVIGEVYGGGGNSGATLKNDFVELRNLSSEAVSVAGWSVQYASSAGTSWQRTALTGSIPAGGTYLVQQAAGNGGTTDLPSPDVSGSISMGGPSGKVALTDTSALCAGPACAGDDLVDLVGYGSANAFEGRPTPALSNTHQRLPHR